MRRFALAVVLTCGSIACAAAQTSDFENFDIGGLPAAPQTSAERDLARMITGYRPGDAAAAVQIQRRLAAYYRSKGDNERARAAEDRANAAGAYRNSPVAPGIGGRRVPARGNMAVPGYGGGPAPGYGVPGVYGPAPVRPPAEEKPPAFGNVPAPPPPAEQKRTNISVYQPDTPADDNKAPATPESAPAAATPEPDPAPQPAPVFNADPGAAARATELSGRYFMMQGQVLHTWEFRPDGTFEHGWSRRGADTDAMNFEAGTYNTSGGYMTLFVTRRSGRDVVSIPGGRETRRLMFQPRGAQARDGMVLDGITLRPRLP